MTGKRKLMQERIRRVRTLFHEAGYKTAVAEQTDDSYSATFSGPHGVEGGLFIERSSRFLEIGYTFSFSSSLSEFLRDRLEEILRVAYEYGCYLGLQTDRREIVLSIFTKLYFSGLNYYCLRDSLRDFNRCVAAITAIIDIERSDGVEDEGEP